jgi:hypothetical protein
VDLPHFSQEKNDEDIQDVIVHFPIIRNSVVDRDMAKQGITLELIGSIDYVIR